MPNLCPKNHDKDVVGITKQRRCRECERAWNRVREQYRRERTKTPLRYPHPRKRVKPVTDGLEALYGPVPDLVPDSEWFDEVIVSRALNKQPTGRAPFVLEWAEIFRRQPRSDITDEELAHVAGTTFGRVSKIRGSLVE